MALPGEWRAVVRKRTVATRAYTGGLQLPCEVDGALSRAFASARDARKRMEVVTFTGQQVIATRGDGNRTAPREAPARGMKNPGARAGCVLEDCAAVDESGPSGRGVDAESFRLAC